MARTEMDAEMIRHAEQRIHRLGGEIRLNERVDAGGGVVQAIGGDEQAGRDQVNQPVLVKR